jgi:hypothetical protein
MKRKIRLVYTKKDPEHLNLDSWSIQRQTIFGNWFELTYKLDKKQAMDYFEHLVFGNSKSIVEKEILFEAEISSKNKTSEAYEAFKKLTQ